MRGHTIVELLVAMVLAAVLMAIAVPPARGVVDRASVRTAAADVRSVLGRARGLALAGRSAVGVEIDTSGAVRVRRGGQVLLARPVGQVHGVGLTATRDSLTYDAYGLGRGAANLSIVIRRRAAAETVFVSRLGRVR